MDQATELKQHPESAKSSACDAALAVLSRETSNPQAMKNVSLACAKGAENLPKGMAASHELLPANSAAVAAQHDREMANFKTIDAALSRKGFLGGDNPDEDTLTNSLKTMSSADRVLLQKDYANARHEPLQQAFVDKFGTATETYQYLKGLLLRTDRPESAAAVNLHMALWQIDDTKRDQDQNDTATRTGYANNMIHHGKLSPGFAGAMGALGSLVDGSTIGSKTQTAETALAKLSPQEVAAIQKEHVRIYHRELGEMAEDTHGASPDLVAAFERKGF